MAVNTAIDAPHDAHALVAARVAELLDQTPAYRALPAAQQQELAEQMTRIGSYIVSGAGDTVPKTAVLAGPAARQLDDPGQQASAQYNAAMNQPLGPSAGERYKSTGAVAESTGADVMTNAITKVNFPAFVAGLIDGVFAAIVRSSIQQMQAYAELVKNVSKSLDDFMKDNISTDSARGYLADRYPDNLELDTTGRDSKLKVRPGSDDSQLPDFFKDLGLDQTIDSLDDDSVEQTLVPAARRRMALDRQQLLATMILMGINRLIVTDGHIEAACLFELRATDSVSSKRTQTGSLHGEYAHDSGGGGFWGWLSGSSRDTSSASFDVSTTAEDASEAKSKLHMNLSGKVRVNFRSDVVPLERIANIIQLREIQQKAPAARPATTTSGAPAAPPGAPAGTPVPAGAPAR